MYSLCYVLTDNEKLRYYNQLLISLASLGKTRFSGQIIVVMDRRTDSLIRELPDIEKLGGEKIERRVVETPLEYSAKETSRYLKTTLREHIRGDFLFIDTDTIIAENLPEHVSNADLALVREQFWVHSNGVADRIFPDGYSYDIGESVYERSGYSKKEIEVIFNGGVMWVRDSEKARLFFKEWHAEWEKTREKGITIDQTSLNFVNARQGCVIEELDGIWNCQVMRPVAQKYLDNALILHYFNGRPTGCAYLLSNEDIQRKGYLSDDVQLILSAPKKAFLPLSYLVLDGATEEVLYSKAFRALKTLYRKHLLTYRAVNFVFSIPEKIGKLFPRKTNQ